MARGRRVASGASRAAAGGAASGGTASGSVTLAALRVLRPGNALVAAAGVYAGSLLAGARLAPSAPVLLGAGAAFAFAAAGNVRNDILDIEIDRRAHPTRPLVTGALPVASARGMALGLYLVALGLAVLVSWWAVLLVLLAIPLMEGYERALKARGLPGNVAIALLTGAPFVLGGVAAGRIGGALLAVAALAALATAGREIVKDVEDMDADRGARRTLPLRIGPAHAARVGAGFLVAAALLSPLPWVLETVLGWAYLPAVGLADVAFVSAAVLAMRAAPASAQRLAKAGMVLALLAIIAGRAQAGSVLL